MIFYRIIFFLLFSAVLTAQPKILQNIRPLSPSEKYVVTNWNSNSGLPQNSINRIVQDKNGYIWLATYGGLVRFDGLNFKTYTTSTYPVLQSDRINSLFLDSRNRLWISNELGKLIVFDGITFTDITGKFSDSYFNVYQFAEDSKGNYYICSTTRDLYFYSNEKATKIDFLKNGQPIKITTIFPSAIRQKTTPCLRCLTIRLRFFTTAGLLKKKFSCFRMDSIIKVYIMKKKSGFYSA